MEVCTVAFSELWIILFSLAAESASGITVTWFQRQAVSVGHLASLTFSSSADRSSHILRSDSGMMCQ